MEVLSAIIETYIASGDPVGSKLVAEILGNTVSPATIRNDMAGLFDMGLLEQPHTSAGRTPSHLGYRMYVDNFMVVKPILRDEVANLEAMFNVRNPDPDKLLKDAAAALADITGCAAVSTTMTPSTVTVNRVEIIPAAKQSVVIMLIASSGVIKNKVLHVDFVVTGEVVDFFTKFCNAVLCGQSIQSISSLYLNSVAVSLGEYARVFTPLLGAINEICNEISRGQFYSAGQINLLSYPELSSMAYELFTLLENQDHIQKIIDQAKDSTSLLIGKENMYMELSAASVFVKKYNIGDHSTGALAVIGSTRIDYGKIIPYLEYFSRKLGNMLSDLYNANQQS